MHEEIQRLREWYRRFLKAYERLPIVLQVIVLILAFALVALLYILYPPF